MPSKYEIEVFYNDPSNNKLKLSSSSSNGWYWQMRVAGTPEVVSEAGPFENEAEARTDADIAMLERERGDCVARIHEIDELLGELEEEHAA